MTEAGLRTALVTGASGTIGRPLCARLRQEGWRVIGVARHAPAACEGDAPWHRLVAADVAAVDAEALAALLEGERVDVVWHLAGKAHAVSELRQDPGEYLRINAGGTRTVLEAARRLGARRLVLASSVKAMGEGGAAVLDETAPCAPETPYGASKLEAERLVLASSSPEPVVLRFCMVYGGGQRGNMDRMIDAIRRRLFPPFPDTGNRRSILYVEDAVSACIGAGVHPAAAGGTFIVTDGELHSTAGLDRAIRRALGRRPPRAACPVALLRLGALGCDAIERVSGRTMPLNSEKLAKLVESAAYSSSRIGETLGFAPARPLGRALRRMCGAAAAAPGCGSAPETPPGGK